MERNGGRSRERGGRRGGNERRGREWGGRRGKDERLTDHVVSSS